MTFNYQDTGVKAFLKSLGADNTRTGSGLVNFFVTYSGWLLLAFVLGFYLLFPSAFATLNHVWFRVCVAAYFVYLIFLEIISRTNPKFYETSRFRIIRIQVMMLFGSGLVYVSGAENSPLWFIYLWPLFSASLYFKQSNLWYAYIEVAVLYVLTALLQTGEIAAVNFGLLLVNLAVMLVISVVFFYLVQTVNRYGKAEERIRHFELLDDIRREMDSAVSLQEVLDLILQKAITLVGVSDGSLMLRNEDGDLEFRAHRGKSLPGDPDIPTFKEGEGIAGRVLETGKPYICNDTKTDPNFAKVTMGMPIRSLVSVPIVSQTGIVLGIINVDSSKPHRFSYTDADLLSTLAMQVAQVVERTELWDSLSRISAEALSDNTEGLYENIVDVVHRLTHYPVLMWLVDELKESRAFITAHRSVRDEYVQKRGEALGHSITGRVVDEGKEIVVTDIVSNTSVSEATREEAEFQGWKSLIAVPLLPQAGKAVGALTVFRTAGGQFTPWETNLLKTFASQAGIAIRGASQMQRERGMREQAETMGEISRLISSNIKLEEVTKNILVELKKVVGYCTASIQLLQGDNRVLLAKEGFEEARSPDVLLRSISKDDLIRRVVEGRVPIILPDVTKDPDWEVLEPTREVKSWVGLPLVYREQTIGLLTLDHDEIGFYNDKLKDTLVLFAQQAAIAVQNALLYSHLEQLLEVGRDISNLAIQEPKATLERIARELCNKLSADCVVIYPYDLTRTTPVSYYYDLNNTASFGLHYPLSLSDKARESGMTKRVREAKSRILEIDDISSVPSELTRPFIERENVGAFLGVALDDNSEELGILYVNFRSQHTFTAREREITRNFVAEIVGVLQSNKVEVKRARSGGTQLPSLLKRITDNARGLLGADIVILYQYRRGRDVEFVIPPVISGELRSTPSFMARKVYETDIPALLVKDGHPYYADNIEDEPLLLQDIAEAHDDLPERPRFTVREGLRSSAGVLLKSEDEIVGVMFINYRIPTRFTQELRKEIDLFASQAAIAIRSARIVEQTQALVEVGRAIADAPDLPQLLDLVLEEALNLVGFSNGWISLINPESNKLEVQASRGLQAKACLTLNMGEGITGHVAETGLVLRVSDVTMPQEGIHYVACSEDTRSELCVPLKYTGQTLGVLNLESPRPEAFTARDEELMTALADIAATVIHSMRGRLQDIAAVQVITEAIGEKKLDGVFNMIAEKAVELTEATYSTLWLLDEAEQILRVGAVSGREAYAESLALHEEGKSINRHVALSREAYYSGDVKKDPHYIAWYDDINSNLCVPLVSGGRLLGTLHVESVKFNAFTEYQRDLLQALGNQAAIAIEKAKGFAALQAINDAVTEKSLPEVLELVVQQAVDVMPGEYGELWLYDPSDAGQLTLEAVVGPAAEEAKKLGRIIADEISTNFRVAKNAQYEIHSNLNQEKGNYIAVYKAAQSSVTVPLIYHDEVVGTLNVESKQLGAFTDAHATLLDSLADQAAIAIVTARLVKQQLEDVALLQNVNAAITTKGMDEVWKLIAQSAVARTQALYCALWSIEGERLGFRAVAGKLPAEKRDIPDLPIDENSINGYVAKHGETYVCYDVENDPYYFAWLDDIQSSVAVPIKMGEKAIGVLGIESFKPKAFSEYVIGILESLANQAAIAIETARLFERRLEDIALLQEINAAITTKGLDEVWQLITQKAEALTQAEYCGLWSVESEQLIFRAMDGTVQGEKRNLPNLPIGEKSINGYVAKYGKTYVCYDVQNDPHYLPWLDGIQSSIAIPLKIEERVIGTLGIESSRPHAFSEHLIKMLESLANQAAIAIQNARLYGRKVDSLQAVTEIGQRLTSGVQLSEREILALVDEQASKLISTKNMYIALYDPREDEVRFPLMRIDNESVEVAARRGGKGRTEWIIRNRESILIETEAESEAWYKEPGRAEYINEPFASWIGVPMLAGEEVLGVIAAYHKDAEHLYDKDDQEVLLLMANYAAVALKNSQQWDLMRDLADDLSTGVFGESV